MIQGFSSVDEALLFVAGCAEKAAFLFAVVLLDDCVEVAVSKAIGVILVDFVGRSDGLAGLRVGRAVFIGEKKVKLDLVVVDRLGTNDLVEMTPFSHDIVVLAHVRRH